MENKPRVKQFDTMVVGLPLSTWVVDEDEEATLGGQPVQFVDPASVKIERDVTPATPETMVRMVVTQEMEKVVTGKKDVFVYLFYFRRSGTHPLFSVKVEAERKEVAVSKKKPSS